VYLSYGLAVILGFIGAKLVIHALHTNELPFLNGGEHVTLIPEVPTWLSLLVILATLAVTTVASLVKSRRDERERLAGEAAGTGPTVPDEGGNVFQPASSDRTPAGTVSATVPDGRGR
jgi:tellurite resistance protein TerC